MNMRFRSHVIRLILGLCLAQPAFGQTEEMPLDTAGFQVFVMGEGEETYVMKQYYMCFLKRGPNRDQDKETVMALQEAHLANIGRLAELGKIVIAGPFGDDGDLRGIFIMNTRTREEAEELVNSDPAIQAGRLSYELIPWWGAIGSSLK